jgi:hypothetical protein
VQLELDPSDVVLVSRTLARQARIERLPDQRMPINEYLVKLGIFRYIRRRVSPTPYPPTEVRPNVWHSYISAQHIPIDIYFISLLFNLNLAVTFIFLANCYFSTIVLLDLSSCVSMIFLLPFYLLSILYPISPFNTIHYAPESLIPRRLPALVAAVDLAQVLSFD